MTNEFLRYNSTEIDTKDMRKSGLNPLISRLF